MSTLTLTMALDGAAFRPNQADGDNTLNEHEVARLLENAARDVRAGFTMQTIRDVNGNSVGRFEIEGA